MMDITTALNAETILVTGASGFIGGHLCRSLVTAGHRVVGLCRQHPEFLPSGVIPCTLDIADPAAVLRLVMREKPAIVFHLASCVKGGREMALVRPMFEANLAGTVFLMEAAAQAGCRRFILTGSLEEPEDIRTPPSSPYAAAKTAASAYARMFHALYGFPAVIARVFMVYGPDQKDQSKLVPYVINALLQNRSPEMGGGTRPVDWIYVHDVVDGLLRMAAAEGLDGQTVDLGTGRLETVRGVVERLATLTGSTVPLLFNPARDRPMEQVRSADAAATETQLRWRPPTTLDEGLRATVAWHRQHPFPAGAS
jgi:nucleoside-diphosphate-sugar epimerase